MHKLLKFLLLAAQPFYADDPGGGGGGGNPPKSDDDDKSQKFSYEYVKELREENKNWRLKYQQALDEAKQHKDAAEKAANDAKNATDNATKAANERILRAELKAAALKAGMVDIDGLKLADLTKVTLKDDGTVDGADALMDEMKKGKPYLFGTPNSSSSPNNPPPNNPPAPKKATEMTAEEYAAARSQFK